MFVHAAMIRPFASISTSGEIDERLARFAAGDITAFESIFRQYQSEIYGWIMRIVRDRAAAEELTLDTFWRIWKARARFDPRRSFPAWARRIATNVAIAYLKRRPREVAFADETEVEADPAISAEQRDRIQRAFRELPAKLQIAATLALVEQQPYEEIADSLGISVSGVKSRVFRAVRILRKKLKRIA